MYQVSINKHENNLFISNQSPCFKQETTLYIHFILVQQTNHLKHAISADVKSACMTKQK